VTASRRRCVWCAYMMYVDIVGGSWILAACGVLTDEGGVCTIEGAHCVLAACVISQCYRCPMRVVIRFMFLVQEVSELRERVRTHEAALSKANSMHKESLSALTREHERLQEELARAKTTSVGCGVNGCACVRAVCTHLPETSRWFEPGGGICKA
jgi:hypothetical protein